MQVLEKGSTGPAVEKWQIFLIGQGFDLGQTDGKFGEKTRKATIEFQKKFGLEMDGKVGNKTLGRAMLLGLEAFKDAADIPPPPPFNALGSTTARQKVFGTFAFKHKPLPNNKENIVITDDWAKKNIVRVKIPQLVGVRGAPPDGSVFFHQLAAAQLIAVWDAWQKAKLLDRVLSYAGAFNPRFIRGKIGQLSNHAFGSAFDINADFNPLGTRPVSVGQKGSVRELVTIARDHGFFWGGDFKKRPDGMHFEVAFIKK